MGIDQILDISKALLTPIIAVIATYIAWQQWQTNRQKLNLDRYDRRLYIYQEVKKILSLILRDARASYEDLLKFRAAAAEADFLFGPEIMAYIDEIYKRAVKLEYFSREYRDSTQEHPPGYDHNAIVQGMHSELVWLSAQFEPAKDKFNKYLNISK